MSSPLEHQDFLSAILGNPREDTTLLVYADWLEERGDERAAYLRAQVEFRRTRTEDQRRRLVELYPADHLAWVATLEQAGAVEANLTNLEFAWWGTGIGPAREADGTYERFLYHDQPPIPVETLDGTFHWLNASRPQYPYTQGPSWKAFCAEKRAEGYFVPIEFEDFLSDTDLPARIQSCTDNYFERAPSSAVAHPAPSAVLDDGLLVTFYADSQYCVLWAILLPKEPGRYAPIFAGPPDALFPSVSGADVEEGEAVYDPGKPVLAASQFEQFVYRWWIENEIWYATIWDESRRPLTPTEQAYLDHLNRGRA
jgi:uncharacterized protein (TIGR02996 family)